MKSTITYGLISILALTSINSCTKKSDSIRSYHMDATVNGELFHVTTCTANQSGSEMRIDGVQPNIAVDGMPNIFLTIANYAGPGTYVIASGRTSAHYEGSMFSYSTAISGSINITDLNPITGTFSFSCDDSTKVTNGTFTAKNP